MSTTVTIARPLYLEICERILESSPDSEFDEELKLVLNKKLQEESAEGRELKAILNNVALQGEVADGVSAPDQKKLVRKLLGIVQASYASQTVTKHALVRRARGEESERARREALERQLESVERERKASTEEAKRAEQQVREQLQRLAKQHESEIRARKRLTREECRSLFL